MSIKELSELTQDGDRVRIDDSHELRLSITPDDDWRIEDDGDWYGRVEWQWRRDWGQRRPDGMTGAARIIYRDGGSVIWWQPPQDVTDATYLKKLEHELIQLIEYGCYVATLELWTWCQCCDTWGRAESNSIGGIHWGADPADYVGDLFLGIGVPA